MYVTIHNIASVELTATWEQDSKGTFVRRLTFIDDKGNKTEITMFSDSPEKLKV